MKDCATASELVAGVSPVAGPWRCPWTLLGAVPAGRSGSWKRQRPDGRFGGAAALNEEATIESVIGSIPPRSMAWSMGVCWAPVSTDDTEIRAIASPAPRLSAMEQALPGTSTANKVRALWRSLAATSGDIVVLSTQTTINTPCLCAALYVMELAVGPLLTGEEHSAGQKLCKRPLQVACS